MLNVRQFPLGPIQTNCYIVSNANQECLIFDPGSEGQRVVKEIRKLNVKPLGIFLTHAHFDHIGGVEEVRKAFDVPVWIHTQESDWLLDPNKNGSGRYAELPNIVVQQADHLITKEQTMEIGSFSFSMIHTPGHSPGSITYYFENDGIAIVGDTLFENSVGRTDLPGGNEKLLFDSIHRKLLTLPEDTIVYPGHGEWTTIGQEMEQNPFLNGF